MLGFRLPVMVGAVLTTVLALWLNSAAQTEPALAPLSVSQHSFVVKTLTSSQRVQALLGVGPRRVAMGEPQVAKAQAERFLAGETAAPPARTVSVLLFNPVTNRAARALVSLNDGRIISVVRVDPANVPIFREDVDDAFAIAKQNAAVRRALGDNIGRYHVVESGGDTGAPFAVQALPIRTSDPRDPCHADRCLDLIFRGERGYLPIRAHVDLRKHAVTAEEARR